MSQIKLKGLEPNQKYALQLRANIGDGVSEWSRVFNFTTMSDDAPPDVPEWAATNPWVADGQAFVATWEHIDFDLFQNLDFKHYELVISDGTTSITVKTENNRYVFSYESNKAKFNGATSLTAKVRSVDRDKNKSFYNTTLTANNTAPDAPANFVATGIVDGVDLKWDRSLASDVVRYDLHVGIAADFTPSAANLIFSGDGNAFTYNTSTYAMTYFKLYAVDSFGLKSSVVTAQATPISPFGTDSTPPSIPTGLSATIVRTGDASQANLSWAFNELTPGNEDIQAFVIKWYKTSDPTNFFLEYTDKASRTVSINLPQPFASYTFQIASVDKLANYSAYSTTVAASGGVAGPPPQTTGVAAVPSLGAIQLTWTASTHEDVQYGGYYDVDIAKNSGFTVGLLSYRTGNTNLAVAGLDDSTVYYYRVRAVDVDGNVGTWSAAGNTTTDGISAPSPTDGLPVATSPAATASAGIGAIFVTWPTVANADPITYEVHISTTAGFTPTLGGATKVAQTPGTVVTLNKDVAGADFVYGTNYYVRIIAKDADTNAGNAPAPGTVSAAVSPRKAGSGDIITITADQIATSNLGATVITLNSTGALLTSDYSGQGTATPAGWKLSSTEVDIQSGKVNFRTLRAGTMTTSGLTIGAGGSITIDSTGEIRSNTYSAGTSGWRMGSTGLELNDANSSVYAPAIKGGTFTGGNFIVGSGGTIRSADYNGSSLGWSLGNTGITVYNGTIQGATVITNQLRSNTAGSTTNGWTFELNVGGFLEISGAKIYGNTTVGGTASHFIQTNGYTQGSTTGWKIQGDGLAYFNSATIGNSSDFAKIYAVGGRGRVEFFDGATSTGYFYGAVGDATLGISKQVSLSGNLSVYGTLYSNTYMWAPSVRAGTVKGANSNAAYASITFPTNGILIDGGNSGYVNLSGGLNINNGGIEVDAGGITVIGGNIDIVNNKIIGVTEVQHLGGTGTIKFDVASGSLTVASGANIAGRIDGGASSSALVFDGARIVAGNTGYNAATPTNTNTKNFWALSINGFGAYVNQSDEREKNSISAVDGSDALAKVRAIEIKKYKHNVVDPNRWQYGIIAQEVEKVLPDAVHIPEGQDRYMATYQDVWAIGFAATRELAERNEHLEKRLAELEELVSTLTA